MIGRMNRTLCRWIAGLALGGVVAFASAPAAKAQWLYPWRSASPADIAQRLEAQGYVLVAPLRRRPMVYLADVGGPFGYQRLVIDARSGDIVQRFAPFPRGWGAPVPRGWGPEFADREGGFAPPSSPGFGPPPWSDRFSAPPVGGPPWRSGYGGPSGVRIPAAISPVGPAGAPFGTKAKPKSVVTGHQLPDTTPVPPPRPGEPDGSGVETARENPGVAAPAAAAPPPSPAPPRAGNPDLDQPRGDSTPTQVESALPPPSEAAPASKPIGEAAPASQPEAQAQPSPAAESPGPGPQPSAKPAGPDSSPAPSEKSKVSIVPPALFE
jgi:hypothetical protein